MDEVKAMIDDIRGEGDTVTCAQCGKDVPIEHVYYTRADADSHSSKLVRLEAETYRLAVEAAERRGFATISELFKAYDEALLRLAIEYEEPVAETQRRVVDACTRL